MNGAIYWIPEYLFLLHLNLEWVKTLCLDKKVKHSSLNNYIEYVINVMHRLKIRQIIFYGTQII